MIRATSVFPFIVVFCISFILTHCVVPGKERTAGFLVEEIIAPNHRQQMTRHPVLHYLLLEEPTFDHDSIFELMRSLSKRRCTGPCEIHLLKNMQAFSLASTRLKSMERIHNTQKKLDLTKKENVRLLERMKEKQRRWDQQFYDSIANHIVGSYYRHTKHKSVYYFYPYKKFRRSLAP